VAKKTRQEKELSRLRREIEVLKAQKSGLNYTIRQEAVKESIPENSVEEKPLPKSLEKAGIQRVDPKFIKKDLLKTAILAIAALAVITALYLLRSQIPFF
jgi:hypothetical protein